MAYRLSIKAEEDLIDIYVEGVKTFGMAQAERYHDQLVRSFERLADNPQIARQRTEITPPVRVHPCGSHLIIYDVYDDGTVYVIRIRHGREDWITH